MSESSSMPNRTLEEDQAMLKKEIEEAMAWAMTFPLKQRVELLEKINKAIDDGRKGEVWYAKRGITGMLK